jgi:hypothetical protein
MKTTYNLVQFVECILFGATMNIWLEVVGNMGSFQRFSGREIRPRKKLHHGQIFTLKNLAHDKVRGQRW